MDINENKETLKLFPVAVTGALEHLSTCNCTSRENYLTVTCLMFCHQVFCQKVYCKGLECNKSTKSFITDALRETINSPYFQGANDHLKIAIRQSLAIFTDNLNQIVDNHESAIGLMQKLPLSL
ncbi:hypothetical protein V6R21_30605 [Limibacter armeniacum]|uniref:hypothetical protein n=1 Tax=Limibacter armeniacum TaxID=466084 RepID=UPI002FE5EF81